MIAVGRGTVRCPVQNIDRPYSTTDSTPASVIAGYAYDDVIEAASLLPHRRTLLTLRTVTDSRFTSDTTVLVPVIAGAS